MWRMKDGIKVPFVSLGVVWFGFRLVTFNYLPDHHTSNYNINTVYNYTFDNGYLLFGFLELLQPICYT